MIKEIYSLANKTVAIVGDLIPILDEKDYFEITNAAKIYTFGSKKTESDIKKLIDSANCYRKPELTSYISGKCMCDNYAWQIIRNYSKGNLPKFDCILFKGKHLFEIDGLWIPLLGKIVKKQGMVFFGDVEWSIEKSPTLNPKKTPKIREKYTEEQIKIKPIKELLSIYIKEDFIEIVCEKYPNYRAFQRK
jgi:hypothetical protein